MQDSKRRIIEFIRQLPRCLLSRGAGILAGGCVQALVVNANLWLLSFLGTSAIGLCPLAAWGPNWSCILLRNLHNPFLIHDWTPIELLLYRKVATGVNRMPDTVQPNSASPSINTSVNSESKSLSWAISSGWSHFMRRQRASITLLARSGVLLVQGFNYRCDGHLKTVFCWVTCHSFMATDLSTGLTVPSLEPASMCTGTLWW